GIDGRGGAGKSTLARRLEAAERLVTVVEFDDFYRPSSERRLRAATGESEIGGNFDWRRLREQVLEPLSRDEAACYERYDWARDELAEWHGVPVGGFVIIEGNYSTRQELRALYDFTIWIDAPHELRLQRGLRRGGQDKLERWLTEWIPEEDRYIEAENPAERVHLVLDGSGS
nr:uridine kinase [Actinomycetota bacterium]